MVKEAGKPKIDISCLRKKAAKLWNVLIVKSLDASGIIFRTRVFISLATLFVKVIAKIFHGSTPSSEIKYEMR